MEQEAIAWSTCPLVERVAERMNGVPVLKGTRMPADGVVENYATGSSIEEIAENFGLKESGVREVLEFAESYKQENYRRLLRSRSFLE